MSTKSNLSPGRWLKREDFERVKAEHIRDAVRAILGDLEDHPFAVSTNYDVVLKDGTRLAPKAVFGVAARRALGMDVQPRDFRGGEGTPCFKAIRAADLRIMAKQAEDGLPPNPSDDWIEGDRQRRTHLLYERNRAAVHAKKKTFKEEYGKLKCEVCELVPVEQYGDENGDACIEVHHKIPLSRLGMRRVTRIEDLMCVCASCHRVLHERMRQEDRR